MGDGGRQLVSVRFTAPVEGFDLNQGEIVVSTRHRVAAVLVRQDRRQTLFVNDEGEVVARWPTQLIEGIDWSDGAEQTSDVPPSVGTVQWRDEIQDRHPHAYQRWTAEEEAELTEEFRKGLTVAEMAVGHQRRPGGITARLARLGLIGRDTPEGEVGASPPATVVEVTDDVCRHDLVVGTCSICKFDDRPAVYITAGGRHFHGRPDCPALLDGQRAVEARGGTTEPIEIVQRGSARLEGRDPCLRCAQY